MDDGVMSNADIMTDMGRKLLVRTMDNRIVLHVHAVTHMDVVHVPTNDRIEPN